MSSISQGQGGGSKTGNGFKPAAMRISKYDQVSSLLVALTACIGVIFLVLFLIWLSTIVRIRPSQAVVEWNDELAGNNNNPEGIAEDFLEPGVEELADVPEPQLSDAIEAVTTAVSTQKAHLEAVEGNATQMGTGRGLGDHRDPGPGNGGDRKDKPWERWQIRYSTTSPKLYGSQLDFFGIELGAISRATPTVVYLKGMGTNSPQKTGGTKSLEKRIYFNYRQGKLKAWDEDFFKSVGVQIQDYVLVQFYPTQTQQRLMQLERQAIGNRSLDEVHRTVFGVRAAGNGYEYYVMNVQWK